MNFSVSLFYVPFSLHCWTCSSGSGLSRAIWLPLIWSGWIVCPTSLVTWCPPPTTTTETVCQKCKRISHIWMLVLGSDPPWRHRPPADVPSAAPAIIIKEVNSSICSEPLTPTPPTPTPKSFSTFMYPRPNTHTHTPTALHVSDSQAGRRHISEWGASELEQKKHHWSPDPNQLLPTTLHLLHRSALDQSKLLTLSPSHTRIRARTHTPRVSCECSSAPSPALPSQHAAPGGGGSSHGGPAQR